MSEVTKRVAAAVSESGISLRELAIATGIPYMKIYDSLANKSRDRDLRDWELLAVCKVLKADPIEFAE